VNNVRPKNLDLFTIRFPLPAIVSILHRISGIVLFLLIPVYIALLQYSLTYAGFERLQSMFHSSPIKLICYLLLLPFLYHLLAGIRHLFADLHIGTSLAGGKLSSQVVFLAFVVLSIILGVWIW